MFETFPNELLIRIFNFLNTDELFVCMQSCLTFNVIIKSYPWAHLHHKIIITKGNVDILHWFLLNFRFQRFKIRDPTIKLDDRVWELLSERADIRASITHLTKIFDTFTFEIVDKKTQHFDLIIDECRIEYDKKCLSQYFDVVPPILLHRVIHLDSYIVFNNCIRIPCTEFAIDYILCLAKQSNGTMRKIYYHLCSKYNGKPDHCSNCHIYPESVKCNKLTICDTEELQEFLDSLYAKKRTDFLSARCILDSLIDTLSRIRDCFILEKLLKIITQQEWIDSFVKQIKLHENNEKIIGSNPFHDSSTNKLNQLGGKIWNKVWKKNTHPNADERILFEIAHIVPKIIKQFSKYSKNFIKWETIDDFRKYHPNYLEDLTYYNKNSLFALDDKFFLSIRNKKKNREIISIVSKNPYICNFISQQTENMEKKILNVPIRTLNHQLLITFTTNQIYDLFHQGHSVDEWILNNGHMECYEKCAAYFKKKYTHMLFPSVDIYQLLLNDKKSIMQYILDNKIPYKKNILTGGRNPKGPTSSYSIYGLLNKTTVGVLDLLHKNDILPNGLYYAQYISNNPSDLIEKTTWFLDNSKHIFFSDDYNTYFLIRNKNDISVFINLQDFDFSIGTMYTLIKRICFRRIELSNKKLSEIFYQSCVSRNINLLYMLHEYYSDSLREILIEDPITHIQKYLKNGEPLHNCMIVIEWLLKKKYSKKTLPNVPYTALSSYNYHIMHCICRLTTNKFMKYQYSAYKYYLSYSRSQMGRFHQAYNLICNTSI